MTRSSNSGIFLSLHYNFPPTVFFWFKWKLPPVCPPKNWERNPCWQFDSFLRTSNRSKSSAENGSVMENQITNMHFKGFYCNQLPLLSPRPPTHKITWNNKNIMRSVSPIQYHWYYTNNGDSTPTPSSAVEQPHHPELHPPDGRRHWHLQHARHTAWPAHVPHRCRTILALYWKCYEYEQQLLWLCWWWFKWKGKQLELIYKCYDRLQWTGGRNSCRCDHLHWTGMTEMMKMTIMVVYESRFTNICLFFKHP